MQRKGRVMLDIILARVGIIIGWIGIAFWSLMVIVGGSQAFDAQDPAYWAVLVISVGFIALHVALLLFSRRTKRLVQDFRLYSTFLARNPSLSALGASVNEKEEDVRLRLQTMCRRGYFNGRLDLQTGRMLFSHLESSVARCPGCGATTNIYHTGDTCRYCGNPLIRNEGENAPAAS